MSVDYEIVCLDENGGISRAIRGMYNGLGGAMSVAAARAPAHCSRVVFCAVETNSVVWEGSREEMLDAAGAAKAAAA